MTGFERAWPDMIVHDRILPCMTGFVRIRSCMTGYDRAWPETIRHDREWPDTTGHGRIRQYVTGHDRIRQYVTGHDRIWPGMTGYDRKWSDTTGNDPIRPEMTRYDRKWPDTIGCFAKILKFLSKLLQKFNLSRKLYIYLYEQYEVIIYFIAFFIAVIRLLIFYDSTYVHCTMFMPHPPLASLPTSHPRIILLLSTLYPRFSRRWYSILWPCQYKPALFLSETEGVG
jgi:hypothetical protein